MSIKPAYIALVGPEDNYYNYAKCDVLVQTTILLSENYLVPCSSMELNFLNFAILTSLIKK